MKANLQKKEEDHEFKRESNLRNTGSIIGTPSPFEKKDFIATPNDFVWSSSNNTPIVNNKTVVDKTLGFEGFSNFKDEQMKTNKNFISKEYIMSMKNNENTLNATSNYDPTPITNNNNNKNEYLSSLPLDRENAIPKLNNVFNVNINPNVNLFNFPVIKATGHLTQLNNNGSYFSEGNNGNYSSIFKFSQPSPVNINNPIKNDIFSVNGNNVQQQKYYPSNNSININNTINININNNIVNNNMNHTPHTIGMPNSTGNNYGYNKGGKYVKQNLNYAEMDKEELAQYVDVLGKDQAGCRLLQKRISEDPSFSNDHLYHEMLDKLIDFMYDAFGNYLVQKILENVSDEKKKEIIRLIEPEFLSLGCSPHGTRVIQKIIEVITHNKDLIYCFIKVFEKYSINLMKDINGNHIIIKFVFTMVSPLNDFIYKQLVDNIVDICTHKHGCCVLQKCIEGANDKQRVCNFYL